MYYAKNVGRRILPIEYQNHTSGLAVDQDFASQRYTWCSCITHKYREKYCLQEKKAAPRGQLNSQSASSGS